MDDLSTVADQYHAKFGEDGAFDRALFPELATVSLMAEALRRDSPVTQEDLEAMHQQLYRQPMPTPETTSHPSGAGVTTPSATVQDIPAFFTEVPPPPVVEEPPAAVPAAAEAPSAEQEPF